MYWFKTFTVGFLIGLANLIPGVSGGTFALILGVYERLIGFLNNINSSALITLGKLSFSWLKSGFKNSEWQTLRQELVDRDYPFIAVLGCGSVICIIVLSAMMKYLLTSHFTATYGYFFGLIVLSVVIPWRMLKTFSPMLLLPLLIGITLTIWVTASVNPYEKTLAKSELLREKFNTQTEQINHTEAGERSTRLKFIGKYSSGEYIYIALCGMVAISAMVLPGISGSLVLILMNQYFAVISAIANLRNLLLDDLLFLSAMTIGMGLGLLTFARVIDYGLKKFHDQMISFLIGLIIGSLWALWPFKQAEVIVDYYVKEGTAIQQLENVVVYSNVNILPETLSSALLALVMVFAGLLTMLPFVRRK